MTDSKRIPIRCPTWGSTHFAMCISNGRCYVEVRCKSDRGEVERYSREYLERQWAELEEMERLEREGIPHD